MAFGRVLQLHEVERYVVIQLDDTPEGEPIKAVAYEQHFIGNYWEQLLALPGHKRFTRILEFNLTYRGNKAPLATNVVILPD